MVGDLGQVYRETAAWIVCLWALAKYRARAHWLTTPAGRPFARGTVLAAARYRSMAAPPCAPGARECAAPPGGAWAPDNLGPVVKEEKNVQEKRPVKAAKSEQTRTLILETALRLFAERGYDRTTMRAIAQEAGVSVGNAYYYFSSKEHLVQGFYDRIAGEHATAVRPVLEGDGDLTVRIRGVLLGWLDVAEPYHRFAAQFFKNAADPDSPLSPFSEDSAAARDAAISIHERCIAGADVKSDRNWLRCCRS